MNGYTYNDDSKISEDSEASLTTSAEPIDYSRPTISITNYFNFNGSEAINNVEKYLVGSPTQSQSQSPSRRHSHKSVKKVNKAHNMTIPLNRLEFNNPKQGAHKMNDITQFENGFIFEMNANGKSPSFQLRPLQQPKHQNTNNQKHRNKNANGMSGINKPRQSNGTTTNATHSFAQTHQQHPLPSNTNNSQRLQTTAHRNGNAFVAPSHSHNNGNIIRNVRNESELQRRNVNNMQRLLTHNIQHMHFNDNVQKRNTRNMNNIQNIINNLSQINMNPPQIIQNMQMDMNNNNNVGVPPAPLNNNNNNNNNNTNNLVPQMNTNNNDQALCYPVLLSNEEVSHSNLHSAASVSFSCDDSKPDNIETRAQHSDNKPCIPLQDNDYGAGHGGDNLPATKTKLVAANTNHTNKKHQCSFCKKYFAKKSLLIQHIRVHSKEKPYQCKFENCNKRFSQKGNLKTHLDTHSGIKPFECKLCNKQFRQNSHLKLHLKSKRHLKLFKFFYDPLL